MIIIKKYEYLFYQCYCWSLKTNGVSDFTKYYATLMLSLLLLTNAVTILSLFSIVTGQIVFREIEGVSRFSIVIFLVAFFLMHYTYFSFKGRFLRIKKYYDCKSKQNNKGQLFFLAYIIGSFSLLILSWVVILNSVSS